MINTVRVKLYIEYSFDVDNLLEFVNEHDFIRSGVIGPYKKEQVSDVIYSDKDPHTLLFLMKDGTEWRTHFGDEMENVVNELLFERIDKE